MSHEDVYESFTSHYKVERSSFEAWSRPRERASYEQDSNGIRGVSIRYSPMGTALRTDKE